MVVFVFKLLLVALMSLIASLLWVYRFDMRCGTVLGLVGFPLLIGSLCLYLAVLKNEVVQTLKGRPVQGS